MQFRYPDAAPGSAPTLELVDLHIRPGESMALVGATGSGKTTLTALIPRLHEATSGRITLDGVDITALPREELRSLVAVAFEEPTLFSASVGENVLMGAEKGAGEPELSRALAVAQQSWLSVDAMHVHTTEVEAYRLIGALLAKLAPPDAAVLVHPSKLVAVRFDDILRTRLADGLQPG